MNVTDRYTDDRQTDRRAITYSKREREFTFAKSVDKEIGERWRHIGV